ncbi:SpoOM family protein [Ferrimonas balearica DSM 9799]|uniref:SpoOM family protein n=1 Tax=Ferrimonas balearica (strain DSM 9799 / CCM 4581 / KCTC 23876 / PAT) TaxID=550540 RepID=E1STA0_FERBD|nr:sporulation protein [Ferrimonas balearica]ADN77134.1 SpoOM family protein [Ferrimonas balearica DSM 9799]
MTWMGRLLSSAGIGAARVDTLLGKDHYQPGETIDAKVMLYAGRVDQRIDGIHFSVHSQIGRKEQAEIAHCTLAEGILLKAHSVLELPVKLALPEFTPITAGPIESWLNTGLDIPKAIDPTDTDKIHIIPTATQQAVLDALESLGLVHCGVEIEPLPAQSRLGMPFLQRWQYRPGPDCSLTAVASLSVAWRPQLAGLELLLDHQSPSGQDSNQTLMVRDDQGSKLKAQLRNLLSSQELDD